MYYHEEGIKGFIIICIIAVAMLIVFLIAGCGTHYHIEKKPDGTIVADTRSARSYEYFDLSYNPVTGHFRVVAVGVTDDTAKIVEMAVGTVENVATGYLGTWMPGTEELEWQKYNDALDKKDPN